MWQQDSCTPAVIISDDLTHSRDSVIIFVDKLLNSVIDESVKTLHIWSDGPSSQFKNIFTAASIPWLQQKHKLRICWNFFATSHEKGPVDGIGGVVIIMATQKVIQRKVNITNATSFYDAINSESNVKLFLIEAEEIKNVVETNLGTVISAAPALPGILNAHHLQHTDGKIHLKPYSTATYCVSQLGITSSSCNNLSVRSSENTKTSQADDVKTGSFIIVTYDFASASSSKYVTKTLVALVTSSNKDESTVEVQYATAISKQRVKITSADKGQIDCNDIVRLLPYPALQHGLYEFQEDLDIDAF